MVVLNLPSLTRHILRTSSFRPLTAFKQLPPPHRTLGIRYHPVVDDANVVAYKDKVARKDVAREIQAKRARKNRRNAMASKPSTTTAAATTSTATEKFVLTYYVPVENCKAVTEAVHKTGAGTWPGDSYGETCFIGKGIGQFRPLEGANPVIGKVGDLEFVEESKVEMVIFGREIMVAAVAALKEAHPYEVVAYSVVKAEDT
ncbi:putative GTP cyclohydrolase 1 type 2 [Cyphellophora attinorum]|uniref:ATP phosphoribosyltransferase n=1 Tax=Cyphellophora attinorum TaxID=1664694 RepID=A0A0N1HGC9_9EURO|nr:putative GTP cyclohydrolase 1 type 2 [Phialophora attinorum]KPI34443.1 putative GTP cyclohydrolase 1 type 2 [Phialophora attinorum]